MKKLVTLLAILGGLGLGAEIVLPPFAERQIENDARARFRDAAAVSADIGTFPVVTRLLATGEVPRTSITLTEVARERVTFGTLRFEFEEVELDRDAMLGGETEIRSIERGRITAILDEEDLGRMLGTAVDLAPDRVSIEMQGRSLSVAVTGLPAVTLPLPGDLLPCDLSVELEGAEIILSCVIHEIPEVFLEAVQSG